MSSVQAQRRHPNVVFCSITPYGHNAPPELRNAKSINVFHSSGWGYHTPSHPDPAKPPLKVPAASWPITRPGWMRRYVWRRRWSGICIPDKASSSTSHNRRCSCRAPTASWAGTSPVRSRRTTPAAITTSWARPRFSPAQTGSSTCTWPAATTGPASRNLSATRTGATISTTTGWSFPSRRTRWRRFSADTRHGCAACRKKPRPKRPSGWGYLWFPSTVPRICSVRRSIVIVASSER